MTATFLTHAMGCPSYGLLDISDCICSARSQSTVTTRNGSVLHPISYGRWFPTWRALIVWAWRARCLDKHQGWYSSVVAGSVAERTCQRCGRYWSEAA